MVSAGQQNHCGKLLHDGACGCKIVAGEGIGCRRKRFEVARKQMRKVGEG
jgi:hypothetical protein